MFPFPFESTEAEAEAPVHVAWLAHCFTMAVVVPKMSMVVMHVSSGAWHSCVFWLHISLVEEELQT